MRTFDFVIPANSSKHVEELGDYFRIRSSDGAVTLTTDDGSVRMAGVVQGEGIRNKKFRRVTMTNDTGAIVTVTVAIGMTAEIIDNVNLSGDVGIEPGSDKNFYSVTVNTGSGALAANTNRKRALIYSLKANTVDVMVGTSGNRIEIEPGGFFPWENTSGLNFRTASGTAELAIIEEI